jgi:SNF2 family DNA or RNA helicase
LAADSSLERRVLDFAGGRFLLCFPYSPELVEELKQSVPGARWNRAKRWWEAPAGSPAAEFALGRGFVPTESALRALAPRPVPEPPWGRELEVPGLRAELLPYQREGVAFALERGRALIADQPGLGKTLQALAFLQARKDLRPAVVVCPASLKLSWLREAERFLEPCPENEAAVLSGLSADLLPAAGIYVVNYDVLHAWVPLLKGAGVRAAVFDESHYLKSRSSRRTRAALALAKGLPAVLCLTGTPVLNRPADLWAQLHLLDPASYRSFWEYGMRYCAGRRKEVAVRGGGRRLVWDFSGASNLRELHERLVSTVMVRRLKEDVLDQLPPKRYALVPLELSDPEEYRRAEGEFLRWLWEQVRSGRVDRRRLLSALRAEAAVKVNWLRRVAARLKLPAALAWIRDFLESGQKLVVFVHHREVGDALLREFPGAASVRGGDPPRARQEAVDRFQNDGACRLFVGSIAAAGTGLTLTAASDVALLEFPWRPADLEQCADRVHRIGQASSVTVWCLAASAPGVETVDERTLRLLEAKRAVADRVVDGRGGPDSDVLAELMSGYVASLPSKGA